MDFLRRRKWMIHWAFWLLVYIVYLIQPLFSGGEDAGATPTLSLAIALKALFHLLGVAATSYFICLVVIPPLLDRKKTFKALLVMAAGLYTIAFLNRLCVIYVLEPLLHHTNRQESLPEIFSQVRILFQFYIIRNIADAFPFVIFYLLLDRQLIQRKQAEAENEKKEAELLALKSQLNPHFLFNTLNNIYSLAIQYSPQTSHCIEKLANILDYLLYRCNDKLVPLEQEINLLKDYLDLQKIRFGDRLSLNADYDTDRACKIAPLLLLPLVENIFKHGVEQNSGTTDVVLSLKCFNDTLVFRTENVYGAEAGNSPGIGLQNLKRQLEIIYPGKHSFTIIKDDQFFKTNLQLSLA